MSRSPLHADAIAGISDRALADVVGDHWEHMMAWMPTWATTIGDHRYDAMLVRRDAATTERYGAERDALLARLVAIDPTPLTVQDAITHEMLRAKLASEQALDVARFHEWSIDSGGASLFGELSYAVESHGVHTADDASNVVARLQQAALVIDDTIDNLRTGLTSGRVAAAEKVRRAIDQLDTELARPLEAWPMATPAWVTEHAAVAANLREVVRSSVMPALARLRDVMRDEILPHARTVQEGLIGLPDGDAAYRATILQHVGIAMTPAELHELGREQIAKTDEAIAALGKRVLGTPDLATTIARLRTDTALYFTTREEILAAAQAALERANAAVPAVFSTLPVTPCVMREVPAYEAPYTTIAYYRQPHYDGSKPGEYFVNTYKPETRPRYELEALTWHESVPGHHTQIAIAMELGAIPAFRKLELQNAYVEGWALYTEELADELGLYTSDLDRLGKLSYAAWRASRLVVDTGLHALGWTRSQAEAYMREHTALTEVNISNEVDRYIGWPGQALAYKVGQLKFLALRAHAREVLGAKFSLAAFHAVVLGSSAVTLPVLEQLVDAWIRAA